MALFSTSNSATTRDTKVHLDRGLAGFVGSVSIVGLSFGLSAPALALEPSLATDEGSGDRLSKLQSLQAGARRAQRDRLQQAQPETFPAASSGLSTGDGIYLYGEQPVHDQIATAYFVFERNTDAVSGAFYTASSSFDCAQGSINSDTIQLTITDSYSQESYGYAVGLASVEESLGKTATAQLASQQAMALTQGAETISIEGFYPLPVRARDRAILATCQNRQ